MKQDLIHALNGNFLVSFLMMIVQQSIVKNTSLTSVLKVHPQASFHLLCLLLIHQTNHQFIHHSTPPVTHRANHQFIHHSTPPLTHQTNHQFIHHSTPPLTHQANHQFIHHSTPPLTHQTNHQVILFLKKSLKVNLAILIKKYSAIKSLQMKDAKQDHVFVWCRQKLLLLRLFLYLALLKSKFHSFTSIIKELMKVITLFLNTNLKTKLSLLL